MNIFMIFTLLCRRLVLVNTLISLPCLDDELRDVIHLDPDGPLEAATDQDLRRPAWRGRHARTEGGAGADAGSDTVDARHEDVVTTVLRRVVRAPVSVHAPVAGEQRRHAGRARAVCVAVEECKVRCHKIWTILYSHR